MTDTASEYWKRNANLESITPSGERFPEGFDVISMLKMCIPEGEVLDFGCGDGRMVPAFEPYRYTGVDINPHALKACAAKHPNHVFRPDTDMLPRVAVALCYTVLLHVPDDEIHKVTARLAAAARRVIVVEIMGRGWRRQGNPPVFNREAEEYESLFNGEGMKLSAKVSMPYDRYGGVPIEFLEFRR